MDNIDLFIEYLKKETNDSIKELEKRERDSGFPIIKKGVQNLLMVLMELVKPEYILELGTGTGFSSILMLESTTSIKKITTVELKEKNQKRALKNFADFRCEERVDSVLGDACEVLSNGSALLDSYDFIFIDCAKGQYANLWADVSKRIRPGGIILTDDVLQNKSVAKSRFLINRRDRTIHKRMREFLYEQMNDENFTGSVFEIDDGVSLFVRNDEK